MTEIVVGIDDSAGAQDALAFAERLAAATGASLRHASALPHESPPHALHDLAQRSGAALVVVGSTRRGPAGRILPGSTGERLLHGSPCPVAVVPRGYADAGPIETIGVGYDGSDESEAALTAACQVARRFGAALRVIRVFDATRVGSPALMTIPGYVFEHANYEAVFREGLDEAVAALPHEVAAEKVFLVGPAGPKLAAQSEFVDLMLVGSRGYGPRAAVLLGGVTHTVLRKAACPVIVLPRGSRGLDPLFADTAGAA